MVVPIEPGSGGGITLVVATLRPVGAAGDVGASTGPMMTGASESAGADVGIEGVRFMLGSGGYFVR